MGKRLREQSVFILAVLASGRSHGYAIIASVEELSDGRLTLTAGTLYGALERLHKAGLVERAGEESAGGPPRRYYEITPAGQRALADEVATLSEAVRQLRGVGLASP